MMIAILLEYGLFLAKTITIVAACLIVISAFMSLLFKSKAIRKDQVQVVSLNEKYKQFAKTIEQVTLPKHLWKSKVKKEKASRKKETKKSKQEQETRNRIFVIDFIGDIKASAVESLREEITAVLTVAKPGDEVLVRLESSGGMVHTYGLAASQLMRIRKKEIPLTIAVDKVAASGGYMMACTANRIISAPFAIIGSIGVIAQLPNFNRLLKKKDIDYEQITAGEFKRTLTVFGENTDDDRDKLKQELEETHSMFKDFVMQGRKNLDISRIATGEHWYGNKALELNLVDELVTSDDYLLTKSDALDIFIVKYETRKTLPGRLASGMVDSVTRFLGYPG
ncbi:MAG: protease SohB [Proteobacteria bacterium]|nr:protease SohB [Pseudomonadota bacterium]